MPTSIREVEDAFANGAESVTFTREEWADMYGVLQTWFANRDQVRKAEREYARIKSIATPLWRACTSVSKQMQNTPSPTRDRLRDWEMQLRHATDVRWEDLPPTHPKRAAFGR